MVAPVARQQRVLDVVAHHPERLGVAAVDLDLERLGPDLGQAPVERPVAGGVGDSPAVPVLVGQGREDAGHGHPAAVGFGGGPDDSSALQLVARPVSGSLANGEA
jgi:hypothetical protein